MNGAITFPERIFFLAVDRRHIFFAALERAVSVFRDNVTAAIPTPQPQRANHERSVSGLDLPLILSYPEPTRVGIGVGGAAVVAQDGCMARRCRPAIPTPLSLDAQTMRDRFQGQCQTLTPRLLRAHPRWNRSWRRRCSRPRRSVGRERPRCSEGRDGKAAKHEC